MSLDFNTLDILRQNHPAWRLLNSSHAPLIASFLQRVFIAPNERVIAQADLVEVLEDGVMGTVTIFHRIMSRTKHPSVLRSLARNCISERWH